MNPPKNRRSEGYGAAEAGGVSHDAHGKCGDQGANFERHRPLLFAIAYRMLGSGMDAEDIVQDTYLRWEGAVEAGVEILSPRAWLSAVATRLCIDHLRAERVRRERYVGPWLPEPLVRVEAPDVTAAVALAESVSIACLVLLESLTPVERAVFLLHDVFGYGYAEIASAVGRSESNCRQLAHRARARLAARRPRFQSSPDQRARLLNSFLEACVEGNLQALLETLTEEVTVWLDEGGIARAARRPIYGADKVARFLLGIVRNAPAGSIAYRGQANGAPAVLLYEGDRPMAVAVLDVDVAEDGIQAVYIVVNPEKLGAVPNPGGL